MSIKKYELGEGMENNLEYDAFLSYNHKDKTQVKEIANRLKEQKLNIFFDQYVKSGSSWPKELESAIGSAKVLLVFVGKSGMGENHENEVIYARNNKKRNIPIIPILLKDFPSSMSTPLILARYNRVIDMKHDDYLEMILKAIKENENTFKAAPHKEDMEVKIVNDIIDGFKNISADYMQQPITIKEIIPDQVSKLEIELRYINNKLDRIRKNIDILKLNKLEEDYDNKKLEILKEIKQEELFKIFKYLITLKCDNFNELYELIRMNNQIDFYIYSSEKYAHRFLALQLLSGIKKILNNALQIIIIKLPLKLKGVFPLFNQKLKKISLDKPVVIVFEGVKCERHLKYIMRLWEELFKENSSKLLMFLFIENTNLKIDSKQKIQFPKKYSNNDLKEWIELNQSVILSGSNQNELKSTIKEFIDGNNSCSPDDVIRNICLQLFDVEEEDVEKEDFEQIIDEWFEYRTKDLLW